MIERKIFKVDSEGQVEPATISEETALPDAGTLDHQKKRLTFLLEGNVRITVEPGVSFSTGKDGIYTDPQGRQFGIKTGDYLGNNNEVQSSAHTPDLQ